MARFMRKLRNIFRGLREKEVVLVFVDWENIEGNITPLPREKFDLSGGLERLMRRIASEVGKIKDVYIFAPVHSFIDHGELFYRLGFRMVVAPKVMSKEGKMIDTTDATLIDFGKMIINMATEVTRVCLASGDKDFATFLRWLIRRGVEPWIIAASKKSLAAELFRLVKGKVIMFSAIDED